MPTSLEKTRKSISKKRGGEVNALHEKSRDSRRLHKANARDIRLEKLAAVRGKKEQPIVDRVAFFQQALKDKEVTVLELSAVQELISTYVHQYDEEYHDAKKARRPGRPPSAREDLLKAKISALEREYKQGFLVPDVMSTENGTKVVKWEGSWSYISTIPWIKVSSAGKAAPADFPSKGIN
ncbi:translation machinery-associated protein 16 [Lecanicillium sp. MT-2017a]|nr:translation machinery-associated protein 16 [Lecanicillium sp. MT-2017a]